ncbi:MAG TPA: HD domain-containing phosphohydrolase [Pyrinomonadaceae bacterium]|jgi:response regulator RpfG family c-di-GMP phosphodiesterase
MEAINRGRSRILITDDEPEVRAILCELLSVSYECVAAGSAAEALERLRKQPFDLVVSDIMMQGMSGLEMVPHVKQLAPETLIIMISGAQTMESAIESLRVGAFDYVMKPFDIRHVEAVVLRALEHHALRAAKRHYESYLEDLVRQRTAELNRAFHALENNYRITLKALAAALETRDAETHGHSERVVSFSLRLGCEMGLAQEQMRSLEFGALLHDIGKIGVPDAILRKPGPLTEDEWGRMRQHPLLGQKILRGIEFLEGAARVVAQHHEKWNGSGYPLGLSGQEIDLNARIFAVADTFDAVVSNRVYRNGKSYEAALAELKAHAGVQFDPEVVAAFERIPREEWKLLQHHQPVKKDGRSKPAFILDELPHFVRNELAKLKMKEELHRAGLRQERAA